MVQRPFRGYSWARHTAETDRGTNLAPRAAIEFACSHGHDFTVHFAVDADIPRLWTCPRHGAEDCPQITSRARSTTDSGLTRVSRLPRTPLAMLYERRTKAELDALLAATVAAIRREGGARVGCVMIGGRHYSYRYTTAELSSPIEGEPLDHDGATSRGSGNAGQQ